MILLEWEHLAPYIFNYGIQADLISLQFLVQIITSLSDEERQYLEHEIRQFSLAKQVEDLECKIKNIEEKYQMYSDHFYSQFQAGKL